MRKLLLVALLVSVLLFYGCASGGSQPAQGAGSNGSGEKILPLPSGGSPAGNVTAENKSGYDKTQQAIALAVADGDYASNVTYAYHSGTETVEIKITVKNDTITSASVRGLNSAMMSSRIIGNFNAALPDLVVGKKIDQLSIPRNVAGSSLTTAAFKQYVESLVAAN